jgi:hypothetical protein
MGNEYILMREQQRTVAILLVIIHIAFTIIAQGLSTTIRPFRWVFFSWQDAPRVLHRAAAANKDAAPSRRQLLRRPRGAR